MKIRVSIAQQMLALFDDNGHLLRRYPVSTAALGAGERQGSYQTPRGCHIVRAKIGGGAPAGAVFKARRWNGEICTADSYAAQPERDWILSRILWLSGREPGRNRLGQVDTMRRYIYLHGTPDQVELGRPGSHGCVRMRNRDIIELFDLVPYGTEVEIVEHEPA
ncbi:MAG TPA: L,D-transpeptidase [Pseudogulbenkiania sp.]|nr:L,D-transpeptidase [Pseudogulbenkiania sp.]